MGNVSRRFPWLFALALILFPTTAAAWLGNVLGVIEGDSVTALHEDGQEQIRLWGIGVTIGKLGAI
jgi:hypothetical protein